MINNQGSEKYSAHGVIWLIYILQKKILMDFRKLKKKHSTIDGEDIDYGLIFVDFEEAG